MSRKLDTKKLLSLLQSEEAPEVLAERLGVSREAVVEARCALDEVSTVEVDAILAMPPSLATPLLRAAVQAGREEVLPEAALSSKKEIRKEAKRLAHQLRLQGKEVELPEPEAAAVPAPAPRPAAEPPVLLSPIDSEGHRAMVWTRTIPGRGVEIARLVIDDAKVLDFETWESSRKKLRTLLQELTEGRSRLVEIPRDEGKRQLDRVRFAMTEGGGAPASFATWALQALGPVPTERPDPLAPVDEGRAPADPREVEALARGSDALFSEPEIASWIPEESFLRALSLRIDEAQTSPLYLPGEEGAKQRRDAILAAVDREAERYFSSARRTRYADWLLEAARLMELQGRVEPARMAAATSRRLREGAPLDEVGFGREFAHRLVRNHPALAESEKSSLIVPP